MYHVPHTLHPKLQAYKLSELVCFNSTTTRAKYEDNSSSYSPKFKITVSILQMN